MFVVVVSCLEKNQNDDEQQCYSLLLLGACLEIWRGWQAMHAVIVHNCKNKKKKKEDDDE